MSEFVEIPVVRHYQKGRVCYVGHMTARQSAELTFADHYPPDASVGRLGYQRPPDDRRGKSFGEYLRDEEAGFMTPLLLNARKGVDFVPLNGNDDVGHLRVQRERSIAKIDGQHRGIGVEEHLGDPDYPVPFMMFENLDTELEQDLFIAINREQKKVSMSHVYFVGREEDELAEMVIKLESDPDSPWYHRVNMIGARGTGRSVSLQSLRGGIEDLLSSGQVKALTFEERYAIARTYWRIVAETWPEAWGNPRGHLLTKSIGMIALSQLGGDIVPLCVNGRSSAPDEVLDAEKVRAFLRHARSVDWASGGGDFAGFAGRGGAKRVKDRLDEIIFARA